MTTMTTRAVSGFRDSVTMELVQAELPQVDEAVRASERVWGIGRLPSLVSPDTLTRWKRGWSAWSDAVWAGDLVRVRELGPKIVLALKVMGDEANARGHAPLSVDAWEAATPAGEVLVVCRTQAEARAMAAAPDGRARHIWTVEDLARVIQHLSIVNEVKTAFPGATVERMTMRDSGFAHDLATSDPLLDVLHEPAAPHRPPHTPRAGCAATRIPERRQEPLAMPPRGGTGMVGN